MLHTLLMIVHFFCAAAIVALVLLQRGKGAEAGAGFGAGASGTVFGARGASTALSRATAIFAAIFMINSLLLTYVGTRTVAAAPKTILDTIGEKSDKAKSGVTQTIPVPTAPSPGETAPPSTPADAGATGTAASAPTPESAPAAAPAPGSTAQPTAPAPAPASAPAQPAPGAAPK